VKVLDHLKAAIAGDKPSGTALMLPPPIARTLGLQATAVDEGTAVFQLQARRDAHANPMGTLHGGVVCDLADAAMGVACASLLEDGESFTTIELKTNFFRPVIDGLLEARAKVVNRGKSVVYLECEVVALPQQKLVAKSSSTCTILRGEQARGR
jgi:uncharacterized protein (TIGR00369 family)